MKKKHADRTEMREAGRGRLCWANHLAYRARGLLAQKNIHKELQHISADGDRDVETARQRLRDRDCDTDLPSSQTNDNQKKTRPQKLPPAKTVHRLESKLDKRGRGGSGRKTFGH